MTTTQLTATQIQVLQHALDDTDGRIDWFPDSVKGGARKKVLDAMFNRALITPSGNSWCIAAEGYDALGVPRPGTVKVAPLEPSITDPSAHLQSVSQHGVSQVLLDEMDAGDPSEVEIDAGNVFDPQIEAAVAAIERQAREEPMAVARTPRTRESSKQATVIAMLKRPDGASIPQICEATGWQSHTVRGTFAGALKKKLGLAITSSKDQGAERVYRLA
jgi:hypothetical protein